MCGCVVKYAIIPWFVHHHEESLCYSTDWPGSALTGRGAEVGEGYATWHCLGPFTVIIHIIITVKACLCDLNLVLH